MKKYVVMAVLLISNISMGCATKNNTHCLENDIEDYPALSKLIKQEEYGTNKTNTNFEKLNTNLND